MLTGDLSLSGYIELSTVTEQSACELSLTTDRKCSSTHVSQNLADVKLMSANNVPVSVSSVNAAPVHVATEKDLQSSSAVLSSQASCTASFIAPLPVMRQHQTQTAAAVCSSMVTGVLPGTSYNQFAQTGQPVLEVASCSVRPMLPNHTLPIKVTVLIRIL